MYNVLIADDEARIVELLRLYLEQQDCVVFEANDGTSALEIAKNTKLDLALLDIMMPNMNGFRLLQKLREFSNIPVMIISAKIESSDKILGLNLGADDYITKPFDPLEVAARVSANLRRYYRLNDMESKAALPRSLSHKNLLLDLDQCQLYRDGSPIGLTAAEFKMVKLFMENVGKVFTKNQLFEAVWEDHYIADDNSIMVAVSKLRSKMETAENVYIKTIRGLGYRMEK